MDGQGGFPGRVEEPLGSSWVPPWEGAESLSGALPSPGRGLSETHLEAAEPDHAVHHLGHAEAVPEVVEGVVPVVVVHAELGETRGPDRPRLLPALLPSPLLAVSGAPCLPV